MRCLHAVLLLLLLLFLPVPRCMLAPCLNVRVRYAEHIEVSAEEPDSFQLRICSLRLCLFFVSLQNLVAAPAALGSQCTIVCGVDCAEIGLAHVCLPVFSQGFAAMCVARFP